MWNRIRSGKHHKIESSYILFHKTAMRYFAWNRILSHFITISIELEVEKWPSTPINFFICKQHSFPVNFIRSNKLTILCAKPDICLYRLTSSGVNKLPCKATLSIHAICVVWYVLQIHTFYEIYNSAFQVFSKLAYGSWY